MRLGARSRPVTREQFGGTDRDGQRSDVPAGHQAGAVGVDNLRHAAAREAATGVPQASASAMTKPYGSSHIGVTTATDAAPTSRHRAAWSRWPT